MKLDVNGRISLKLDFLNDCGLQKGQKIWLYREKVDDEYCVYISPSEDTNKKLLGVVHLDSKGRISISSNVRGNLGIARDGDIVIYVQNRKIYLARGNT